MSVTKLGLLSSHDQGGISQRPRDIGVRQRRPLVLVVLLGRLRPEVRRVGLEVRDLRRGYSVRWKQAAVTAAEGCHQRQGTPSRLLVYTSLGSSTTPGRQWAVPLCWDGGAELVVSANLSPGKAEHLAEQLNGFCRQGYRARHGPAGTAERPSASYALGGPADGVHSDGGKPPTGNARQPGRGANLMGLQRAGRRSGHHPVTGPG